MFFHTAGIEVSPWIPPAVAFCISFLTSMGGVSGAFLLLPFQVSILGYTHPSVSATNQLFNVVAIPGGVYRFWKEGRMVWPLTWIVIVGTLPGVLIGALVRVNYLPDTKNFKLFAAGVLLYIGVRLIRDLLRPAPAPNPAAKPENAPSPACSPFSTEVLNFNMKRLEYSFCGEKYRVNVPGVFALSLLVGIIGGIYGIGGGAIIAPFFVAFFGLPVYTVAGAALMGTFVTSLAGVAFYQAIAPFYPNLSVAPDWSLGLLFGLGGLAGIYLGARCQKYVPAKIIKWMLAAIILFTALSYIVEFF